jgi:isoamylase
LRGSGITDISFFNPAGKEMSDQDWNAGFVKCLGVRLAGDLIDDEDERGEPIAGDTLLVLLNAHHEPLSFTLPETKPQHCWERLFDTAMTSQEELIGRGGQQYPLRDRSLVVLRTREVDDVEPTMAPSPLETLVRDAQSRLPGLPPAAA